MQAYLVTSLDTLSTLESSWTRLACTSAKSVFQTPGWVLPWWEMFGRDLQLHCIIVVDGEELVGLAPLMISEYQSVRYLEFIGSPLNDYNAFLGKQAQFAQVGQCILAYLASSDNAWDVFEVFVIESLEEAIGLASIAHLPQIQLCMFDPEPAPQMRLPKDWSEYCQGIPNERRKRFEYYKRRLWQDTKPSFEVYSRLDSVASLIEEFELQRLESWRYRERMDFLPSIIKTDRFSTFLELVCQHLPDTNGLRFGLLRSEQNILAACLYFAAGTKLLKYMQAWNTAFAHLSPGSVLDWLMVEYAIQQNFAIFDFGRGNEVYKFRFGAEPYMLQNAIICQRDVNKSYPSLRNRDYLWQR
jgi:CelD/BcsL family acetyltransferase involved in cellulose biosynthesis